MPFVQVNDVRLYYETMGKGEPLALIGGSLFGRQNWGLLFDKLSRHFKLISYDMRGYGKSDRPIQSYTMELWADDLAGLLDVLKIKKAHVAGTSMGGMIALVLAARHPNRVLGVVADCAFAKPDRLRKMVLQTWRKLVQIVGTSEIFSDHVMSQAVGQKFLDALDADKYIQMTRDIVAQNSVETVVQACLAMERMDLTKELKKIKAPTLVMNAPGDIITPLDMGPTGIGGRKIHEMVAGSTLKIWEGIGHADLLEKPKESAEAIINFLSNIKKN